MFYNLPCIESDYWKAILNSLPTLSQQLQQRKSGRGLGGRGRVKKGTDSGGGSMYGEEGQNSLPPPVSPPQHLPSHWCLPHHHTASEPPAYPLPTVFSPLQPLLPPSVSSYAQIPICSMQTGCSAPQSANASTAADILG